MLMLAANLVWIWRSEPYAWQKEASAEELIIQIGRKVVRPEHWPLLDEVNCRYDRPISMGERGPMLPESALICEFGSSCDGEIERLVWHNRYIGAFTSAEPLSWTIAEICSEMLLPEIEDQIAAEQGG